MILLAMDRAPTVRRFDAQGFLHVDTSAISKEQIRPYYGREIPGWQSLGLDASRVYRLYCPASELAAAADTFNNLPLLSEHVPVDADNIPDHLIIGSTGSHCAFDGQYLANNLVVWKRPAIEGVLSNRKRQISSGYRYSPDMTPGNFQGMQYDGIMRSLQGNHVILCVEGRAGPDVTVGDEIMKLKSRTALMIGGALAASIRPLLAADARVDITDALGNVTAAGMADVALGMDGQIADAVLALVTPHLAADQSLTVDAIRATIATVPVLAADDEIADAAPVVPPVVTPPAPRAPVVQPPVTGLDSAAVQTMVDKARNDALTESTAIRQAERDVFPDVGEVPAMDSAAAYYKLALDARKVDVTGVDPSLYGSLYRALPAASETKRIAQDAKPTYGLLAKINPTATLSLVL